MKKATEKIYPFHYPEDVLAILSEMSFSEGKNIKIIGSASDRRMLYSADYDVNEIVPLESISEGVNGLKTIIRRLLKNKDVLIGDIKMGLVPEWMPVKGEVRKGRVVGYNAVELRKRLKELDSIMTPEEKAVEVPTHPTPVEFLKLQRDLRMGLVRWTPKEVLDGKKTLRDGRPYTLEQAIQSPSISKLDVTAFVKPERFVEISIIYTFKKNGKILNQDPSKESLTKALREAIAVLHHEGNYFKMAKRIYSLAKLLNNDKAMAKLVPLFNSDMGRLYSIHSDMDTLSSLYDQGHKPDRERVRRELDGFRVRFGNIGLRGFIGEQPIPTTAKETNKTFKEILTKVKGRMEDETVKALKTLGLLPLPAFLRI